ncbi:hypothetical protein BLNAU_18773 [Blattamonas nauphoetae]|uniref:Uncharacterized protein n=1 Tax=Blattamonas nauphoetae TaxID=2049346 RepID=A0ABQ9X423_9EUKA|nr:hypothetical protein BLNAU_18773 [Blattamonas nauphoetae]
MGRCEGTDFCLFGTAHSPKTSRQKHTNTKPQISATHTTIAIHSARPTWPIRHFLFKNGAEWTKRSWNSFKREVPPNPIVAFGLITLEQPAVWSGPVSRPPFFFQSSFTAMRHHLAHFWCT